MEATVLNPTQMHLLKLFAFNNSEEYAREIQMVLTRHFQARLDAEADRLCTQQPLMCKISPQFRVSCGDCYYLIIWSNLTGFMRMSQMASM